MKNLQNPHGENANILLVESNILERERFSHIAHQENWNVIICKNGLDVIQWLKNNKNADLLVIEENATPISGYQIADYIKTELGLALPVIITNEEFSIKQEARMLAYAEAVLKKPFDSPSLISLITSTLEKSNELSPAKNDYYSLNYLIDLSGGDKKFIKETIALFISTVNVELRNLKQVLEQKDYIRIREIAHGIKPSFEMIENETGSGICRLLDSEANETEMSKLIDDLNLEFSNINSQLIKDFPELTLA
jgi:CheY-like chemotaxis protein